MTDDRANGLPTGGNDSEQGPRQNPANGRGVLTRLSALAGRALLVERAWPPLVWALAIAILFLAVSWLGLWQFAPRQARIAGVVLFAAALGVALAPLLRLRWPAMRDIAARLDRDAGGERRPASGLADTLANDKDPVARALWAAHQARLAELVRNIRVSRPAPRMAERDPYALRFGFALIAFAAAVAAGPELYGRFASAFDWRGEGGAGAAAASRIDAWIDPPAYAARPPLLIDFKNAEPQKLAVFEDSALVVRGDPKSVETRVEGGLKPADDKEKSAALMERRFTIQADGKATILRDGGTAASLVFAVAPAGVPTIKLTEEPRANLSGSLTLAYKIDDRYGISNARADFALPKDPAKPARSLVEPPQIALQTPATQNGAGDARTTADLSEHPWAGARVVMTLGATSVSGRAGSSGPIEITLPQRAFHNPLARALVEERRDLVIDPDHAPTRVETALGAFAVAPELFDTPANVYLGLKQARTSLGAARTDVDLLDVAALLWAIALQVEDGDLSKSAKDLRAAEQALREALKRGASDEEIKKLMAQLRDAARRFASEMARKAQENGEDEAQQTIDFDKLMDQMEDAARNGSREEAEAMLDQMQNMFENMRSARDAQESPEERQLRRQIDELGKLLRDQQALRDDTFKSDQRDREQRRAKRPQGQRNGQPDADQDGPPPGDLGQEGDDGDQSADEDQGKNPGDPDLERRQKALRDRLAEMQRMLKGLGMKGEKGFDDAEGDMKEAEGDLKGGQGGEQGQEGQGGKRGGKGGKGAAVDAQGRALEALREGAKGLGKQLSQQGQGQGRNGRGGYTARGTRPGEQPGSDPLGRGREGDRGNENGFLREMGTVSERARRVMEELRRRLSDPSRPTDERDYIERLLKHD